MRRLRVVTTRRADEDIVEAVDLYAAADEALALDFVDALETAFLLLGEQPLIGSPRFGIDADIEGLRGLALSRFPYVLLYTEDGEALRVHRVLHTSRDLTAELDGG